jgi:hypothetical protein
MCAGITIPLAGNIGKQVELIVVSLTRYRDPDRALPKHDEAETTLAYSLNLLTPDHPREVRGQLCRVKTQAAHLRSSRLDAANRRYSRKLTNGQDNRLPYQSGNLSQLAIETCQFISRQRAGSWHSRPCSKPKQWQIGGLSPVRQRSSSSCGDLGYNNEVVGNPPEKIPRSHFTIATAIAAALQLSNKLEASGPL